MIKIDAPSYDPPTPPVYNEDERAAIEAAAEALISAFDWAETPEGLSFWVSVHARLQEMAGLYEGFCERAPSE
jgi:hypothetical protein